MVFSLLFLYNPDYDALRALDADNNPDFPSMTDEEINNLPVYKYKLMAHQGGYTLSQRFENAKQISLFYFIQ